MLTYYVMYDILIVKLTLVTGWIKSNPNSVFATLFLVFALISQIINF